MPPAAGPHASPEPPLAVDALDARERKAALRGVDPGLRALREGVWTIGLPVSERQPGFWTRCHLIADDRGGLHVIDPGTASDGTVERLMAALGELGFGRRDVRSIVATHLHPDHLGGADRLRAETAAPVLMHPLEDDAVAAHLHPGAAPGERFWRGLGVPDERLPELVALGGAPIAPTRADAGLADGAELDIPGRTIRALHTPGHTPGHLCLHDEDARLVLTGDAVLPDQFPGLGLGGDSATNPIVDGLASLERLAALDTLRTTESDRVVASPGHGWAFVGLRARSEELRDHHLRRAAEIAAALDEAQAATSASVPPTVFEIAARVRWTAGFAGLVGLTLASALQQTALHIDRLGRTDELRRPGGDAASHAASAKR